MTDSKPRIVCIILCVLPQDCTGNDAPIDVVADDWPDGITQQDPSATAMEDPAARTPPAKADPSESLEAAVAGKQTSKAARGTPAGGPDLELEMEVSESEQGSPCQSLEDGSAEGARCAAFLSRGSIGSA